MTDDLMIGESTRAATPPLRPLGECLSELRTMIDLIETIEDGQLRQLKKNREALEAEAANALRYSKQDKATAGGVTASIKQRWAVKYDPERWGEVVQWAVENGRSDLVQRRLNDARIMELVDAGTAIHPALTPQAFERLEVRRVNT